MSSAATKKSQFTSLSQHATTKASANALDAEMFGGVVTNIEKLLTPNQKRKLKKVQRARNQISASALIIKRVDATPIRNRNFNNLGS